MQNNVYTIEEIRNILNENMKYLAEKFSVSRLFLFGSYAKKLQTPESDIDLLAVFAKPVDMFDFIDLQEYLSNLFEKKIDLGTPDSLKKFVKEIILKEAIEI